MIEWASTTVLLTGGTGSFGQAFARMMLRELRPRKLIIYSRDEWKQHVMRQDGFDAPSMRYFLGDVRDRDRLRRAMHHLIDREQHRLDALRTRPALAKPHAVLDQYAADVTALRERSARCLRHRLDRADDALRHTTARLRALSPAATLNRGYAIVQRTGGAVVRDPAEVTAGEPLRVRLAAGELDVTVSEQEHHG